MDLLATTSASTLIYASIDGWCRHMALDGERMLAESMHLVEQLRDDVAAIPGTELLDTSGLSGRAVGGLDPAAPPVMYPYWR